MPNVNFQSLLIVFKFNFTIFMVNGITIVLQAKLWLQWFCQKSLISIIDTIITVDICKIMLGAYHFWFVVVLYVSLVYLTVI